MNRAVDLRVYAVLDPGRCRDRDPVELAAAAARGGATLFQLRVKAGAPEHVTDLARHLHDVLRPLGIPLLVNDRVDVAVAAGVEGAHVGRTDTSPAEARRMLGEAAILGVTIHHAHEAAELPPGVATYAGLGPVYLTGSKIQADPPLGAEGLRRLIGAVREHHPGLPVSAIAGIDWRNAGEVIAAGADGVAVISDIFMADDVEAATRRLRGVVDAALGLRGVIDQRAGEGG